MNQILVNSLNAKKIKNNNQKKRLLNNKIGIVIYSILFILSIMVMLVFILYSINEYRNRLFNEKLSKNIEDGFGIATLYAKENEYKVSKTNNGEKFSVIGIIKIDKIKISYPILSDINDELLKISPCRFYGPLPNEIGNLCIAGHNYDDNRFFSKIGNLKNEDIISIYDNIGNNNIYSVYSIYETKIDDVSCTSQETNGKKEITLVTCNNFNDKRIIVKAREIT